MDVRPSGKYFVRVDGWGTETGFGLRAGQQIVRNLRTRCRGVEAFSTVSSGMLNTWAMICRISAAAILYASKRGATAGVGTVRNGRVPAGISGSLRKAPATSAEPGVYRDALAPSNTFFTREVKSPCG
jgi:hypothetical protein